MKTFMIQFVALALAIFAGFYLTTHLELLDPVVDQVSNKPRNKQISQVIINDLIIDVELADSVEKRSKGLGGRENLASNSGMLFIFEKPEIEKFWMKGLNFPLDFVWINGDKIVDLHQNIKQPTANQLDNTLEIIQPRVVADKVLEINAGLIEKYQIEINQSVKFISK